MQATAIRCRLLVNRGVKTPYSDFEKASATVNVCDQYDGAPFLCRFMERSWPNSEINSSAIQAQGSSAIRSTTESVTETVTWVEFDPEPNLAPTTLVSLESASCSHPGIYFEVGW